MDGTQSFTECLNIYFIDKYIYRYICIYRYIYLYWKSRMFIHNVKRNIDGKKCASEIDWRCTVNDNRIYKDCSLRQLLTDIRTVSSWLYYSRPIYFKSFAFISSIGNSRFIFSRYPFCLNEMKEKTTSTSRTVGAIDY